MAQKFCTTCGAPWPGSARYCTGCGAPAPNSGVASTPSADSAPYEPSIVPPAIPSGAGRGRKPQWLLGLVALAVVVAAFSAGRWWTSRADARDVAAAPQGVSSSGVAESPAQQASSPAVTSPTPARPTASASRVVGPNPPNKYGWETFTPEGGPSLLITKDRVSPGFAQNVYNAVRGEELAPGQVVSKTVGSPETNANYTMSCTLENGWTVCREVASSDRDDSASDASVAWPTQ